MLNTAFFDKLALLVDGQGLPYIHISMDMSAINTTCGGPLPMAAPSFLVEAIDAPGGVFSLTTTEVLSSDTLFGIAPNSDSFVFNWANAVGLLDISGAADGMVAIRLRCSRHPTPRSTTSISRFRRRRSSTVWPSRDP